MRTGSPSHVTSSWPQLHDAVRFMRTSIIQRVKRFLPVVLAFAAFIACGGDDPPPSAKPACHPPARVASSNIALVLLSGRRIFKRVRARNGENGGDAPSIENVTPEKSSA